MKRIVVLISGNGSNLQAILDACSTGRIAGKVVAVVSNKGEAYGLTRAREAGCDTAVLSAGDYPDRATYDAALAETVAGFAPDLIVMAGFMRILSPEFIARFRGRMLNIHPSLLPKYQGLHTHRRAIEAGEEEHGASVHFVTEELDGGPVVLQARVPIFADDSEEEVAARVQVQEHAIYPLVVSWFCMGRLVMMADKALMDGEPLGPSGYADE